MSQKKTQLFNPLNGNINVTGVVTASSFVGGLTGDVTGTASSAQGLTGTPNITVGSVTAASATFSDNVTIGGTLTYQDVEHIDSVGIITAQQGIQVLANGLDITGVSTFNSKTRILDDVEFHVGTNGISGDYKFYHDSGNGYNIPYEDITGREARFISNLSGESNADFHFFKASTALARFSVNSIDLYSGGAVKLETTSGGVDITGGVDISGVCTATSFSGDGSALTGVDGTLDNWLYG